MKFGTVTQIGPLQGTYSQNFEFFKNHLEKPQKSRYHNNGLTDLRKILRDYAKWVSLLKQQTVSGSGISWAKCKSAPRSRQITTPAPHHSVFYRPDALPAAQPTASKH